MGVEVSEELPDVGVGGERMGKPVVRVLGDDDILPLLPLLLLVTSVVEVGADEGVEAPVFPFPEFMVIGLGGDCCATKRERVVPKF